MVCDALARCTADSPPGPVAAAAGTALAVVRRRIAAGTHRFAGSGPEQAVWLGPGDAGAARRFVDGVVEAHASGNDAGG